MSEAKFVVILKGRSAPLLLKASALRLVGGELRLLQGGEVVAGGPDVEFAAHMDAVPGGEIGAANLLDEPPRRIPAHLVPPPPPVMRIGEAASFSSLPAPFWSFLSGCSLGLLGGIGMTLSHAGVW